MSYVALYRKFRPSTFEDVKGQDHIVRTLKNQIMAGRIQHAYLFCGTRGTGKTSVAKILAKAVNCEHPIDGSPCNECASCKAITAGNSMNVIEIDAASNNGVDNIREIIEEVQYRPVSGKYKVYIIDEVHMLSPGAYNALLKTLEEPPSYVIFILATTEAGKIPMTILSRCQRYDFHRIDADTLTQRMTDLTKREGVQAEEKALRFIARAADGSMRDALSLLDQCMAFYMGEELTYEKVLSALGAVDTEVFAEFLASVIRGDTGKSIAVFDRLIENGREAGPFISDFIWYLRNLLMVQTSKEDAEETVDVSAETMAELLELSEQADPETVMRYIRVLSELQNDMRFATNRRVLAEIAIVRLTRPQMEKTADAVSGRIRALEEQMEKVLSGNLVYAPGNDVSYPGTPAAVSAAAPREESTPPENAAPEDLKKIRGDWMSIISGIEDGFKRKMLESAVPRYNAEGNDNKLYIEFTNKLAERLPVDEKLRSELMGVIERQYGKHVDIEFLESRNKNESLREIGIDEIIKEKIHFDVEEED